VRLGPDYRQRVVAGVAALAGEEQDPGVGVGGGGDARCGHGAHPIEDGPPAGCGRPVGCSRRRSVLLPAPGSGDQAEVGAVNSASMTILTSSATSTPPASRAAFQVSPNSLREILVSPVKPAR